VFGKIILVGIFCASMSGQASGQNETMTLYMENDGTFIKPLYHTDRHYTNGTKLAITDQPKDSNFLKEFSRWNGFGENDGEVRTAKGYFLGQNLYTPDFVDEPQKREKHDMKFAGWLYAGAFAQRAADNQMEHLELNLGVIGPVAEGSETQEFVHHFIHVGQPKGWQDQLGDEFHADLMWLRRERLPGLFKRTENFDMHIEYGGTAGTLQRNAEASIIFRYGINIPNDFGPGRLAAPASACIDKPANKQSFYLFTRAGGKLVQYNRFLSGLDAERVVGQWQIGGVYRYKDFEFIMSETFLTREYKEQESTDSYGAINLTWHF